MRRHILIIVNPAAGRARSAERRLGRFVAALKRQGCTVVLRRAGPSTWPGRTLGGSSGARFRRDRRGGRRRHHQCRRERTGRAVRSRLACCRSAVPMSSRARFGLPRAPEALASLITTGPVSPIWPGRVGERVFVMMASAGFDFEIVAALSPELKAAGWPARLRLGVSGPPLALPRLRADRPGGWRRVSRCRGDRRKRPALRRPVCRRAGRRSGGAGARAGPARPSRQMGNAALCGRICFLGRVPRLGDIAIVRARQASVAANRGLPVQADGEIVGELPITLAVADRPVLLIRPAG